MVLIGFSVVVFMLVPSGRSIPALRRALAFAWWATLLLYEPVMVAWVGGTLGHWALNLRVVDNRTEGNPGLVKAVGRWLLKGLLGVFTFLSMSLTRRHQALHDLLTATTVQIRDPSKAAPHHFHTGPKPDPRPEAT